MAETPMTGRPPEMLQDCDRKLSMALSNTPGARLHAREAASEVEAARASLPAPTDADWLKEAALKINRIILAATLKGGQADDCDEFERITDVDIDRLEAELLALLCVQQLAAPQPHHHKLMTFYGVYSLGALVDVQARSIDRLQERLSAAEGNPFKHQPARKA